MYFHSLILSIFSLNVAATGPLSKDARIRYFEMREISVSRCFEDLAKAGPNMAAPLLQLKISADQMCGCIADMTATAFLPQTMPSLQTILETESPEQKKQYAELAVSIATICGEKLQNQRR